MRCKRSLFLAAGFLLLTAFVFADTTFATADFGTVLLGATSGASTLTFALGGQSATPVFSLLYGSGEFTLRAASCTGGFATCAVSATFTPKSAGLRKDVVVVRDNAGNLIGRMPISGMGKGPQVSVSPGASSSLNLVVNGFPFQPPSAFVLDSADNIYALTDDSNQVFKISSLDQSVRVIAGQPGSIGGYSGDGGPATSAQLNSPRGLALDGLGSLYIADTGNNVIRKLDLVTGVITTVVGDGVQGHTDAGAATSAELTAPARLICDADGNLYFIEQGDYPGNSDYKIHRWDAASQTISVFAGTGVAGDSGNNGLATQAEISPLDIAIDGAGNIYFVQDRVLFNDAGDQIRIISGGTISAFAGSTAGQTEDGLAALATKFLGESNLSFGSSGNMYLTENATDIRMLRAAAPHVVSTVFETNPFSMGFVALDSIGNFYTSDGFSTFRSISTQAKPLVLASTNAGKASDPVQLLYTNTGNDSLAISGISIGGINPGDFVQSNNCGSSLGAGESCTVSVTFTPQAMGTRSAVMAITDNAADSPHDVFLSGNGLTPEQAVLTPSSLSFPLQTAGTVSVPQTITLSNPGIAALDITGIAFANPYPTTSGNFAFTTDCPQSLAAGAQCTISVTFSPVINSFVTGTIIVTDSASDSPQSALLTGAGQGAVASGSVSPLLLDMGIATTFDFGAQQVTFPTYGSLSIASTGTGSLNGAYFIAGGVNTSDFLIAGICGDLLPGSSCPVPITFTPSAPGTRTASVQIGSYSSVLEGGPIGLPQTVTLMGTGFRQTNAIRGGSGYLRVSADFDGDGKADLAYWQPSDSTWHILPSSNPSAPITAQWGLPGDVPVPGDYDGDGKADIAVWRPSSGTWYIKPSSNPSASLIKQWGIAGDIPLVGDFDGDGKADLAVWRQSTAVWYVQLSATPSSPVTLQWGFSGDIPLAGDFDGDGRADFAVWRPSNGTWFIVPSSNPAAIEARQWGASGDTPVAADFDGDGKTDLAVWHPLSGVWSVVPSRNPSSPFNQAWGQSGDIPSPGDFDGDGKADYAVWRPSSGIWWIIPSTQPSAPKTQFWGEPSDVVLSGDFYNDGHSEIARWHPTTGIWTVPANGESQTAITQQWGLLGDTPLLGDFDGDGKADFAVWRPSNGTWYILPSGNPSIPIVKQWGLPGGDIPLVGDYDNDGKADSIVWRPSNGTWYIPSSNPSSSIVKQWGIPGDIPLIGDYDGDGRIDFTVWRPSNGTWYIIPSTNPTLSATVQWGVPGDIPLMPRLHAFFQASLTVWRPSTGAWYVWNSSFPPATEGLPGDVPLVIRQSATYGVYDELALWRPAQGLMVPVSSPNFYGLPAQQLTAPTDMPF